MLEKAKEKVNHCGYKNVNFIYADDISIWPKIDQSFDRIITNQVIQHLTLSQVDNFIKNSIKKLNIDGKIIFFDIIDSRLFDLWRAGLFSKKICFFKLFLYFTKFRILHMIKGGPDDKIMGYAYSPLMIEKIANKYELQMEYVQSMYYEYRYHVIMSRKS